MAPRTHHKPRYALLASGGYKSIPVMHFDINAALMEEREAKERLASAQRRHMEHMLGLRQAAASDLRQMRKNAGISLLKMASLLGVNRGTLNAAEHPHLGIAGKDSNAARMLSMERIKEIHDAYVTAIEAPSTLPKLRVRPRLPNRQGPRKNKP